MTFFLFLDKQTTTNYFVYEGDFLKYQMKSHPLAAERERERLLERVKENRKSKQNQMRTRAGKNCF